MWDRNYASMRMVDNSRASLVKRRNVEIVNIRARVRESRDQGNMTRNLQTCMPRPEARVPELEVARLNVYDLRTRRRVTVTV